MAGRSLLTDDARAGAPAVFVMSYKLWFKRYSLDPSIVGKTFVLNGVPTTLVGIMPPRFTKMGADLWKSVALNRADPEMRRHYWNFQATLKPAVTLQHTPTHIDTLAHRLPHVSPTTSPAKYS